MSEHAYSTHSAGKKIKSTEVMQEFANTLAAVNNDGFYNLVPASFVIYRRAASNIYLVDYRDRLTSGGSTRAVNYADEATAIQAAIDALTSGGRIFLHGGTYTISSTITLDDYITLDGAGTTPYSQTDNAVTILRSSVASGRMIDGRAKNRITLRGIDFDGNSAGTTVTGLDFGTASGDQSQNVTIENCKIRRFTGYGINVNRGAMFRMTNNVIAGNSLRGVYGGAFSDSILMRNYIASNQDGMYLGAGSGHDIIVGNKIEWNSGTPSTYGFGVHCYQTESLIFANNIFDRNSNPALRIYDSDRTLVEGNVFYRNGADAATTYSCHIRIETDPAQVIGNVFRDDGSTPLYCMTVLNTTDQMIVHNDFTDGYVTSVFSLSGNTTPMIKYNKGYVTEASGSATMSAGTTTVTQAHGLAGTPNGEISLNPNWNAGHIWAGAGVTNLTIYCTNAPEDDSTVYWSAEYIP